MALTQKEEENLAYMLYLAKQSDVIFWAEKEFGWRPLSVVGKDGNKREAWHQYLLLASCDGIFTYPDYHEDIEMRGKPIRRYVWRVGRQFGKTENLALTGLYLSIKKPIHYTKTERYKDPNLIGTIKPDGTVNTTGWTERQIPFVRGAKTIMASADADKARTVFDRVMKFINESPKLSAALDAGAIEKKMTPFPELTFHVPGWTEPAWITFRGPGAGGQTARSKTFDYKLYDEADYMPSIFFEAEKATGINAGDNALTILSSTPTGKRGYFYNACFVKNTPVVMADKSKKAIQDIIVGDKVINRWGKVEEVTHTMINEYEGELISFRTTKNKRVTTATANHRFMAVLQKDVLCKACGDITFTNTKYSPCPLLGNHTHIEKVNPQYHQLKDLQIGDFLAIPVALLKDSHFAGTYKHKAFQYIPITDILKQNKKINVYNLTVGEDHSYCVDGYAVANCTNKKLNYFEIHAPSWENPRYTKEFDKDFRDTLPMSTYQHEIEADWGSVEEGVFDWTYFEWVFRPFGIRPDPKNPLEEIKTPIYRIFDTDKGKKAKPYPDEYEKISLDSKYLEKIGTVNILMWLQKQFPNREDGYIYWFGADFGYQSDPTELIVSKERNGINKVILRINLQHIPYMLVCDIIAQLDIFYQFQALGMDEGNNGMMIKQVLQGKDEHGFNRYKKHNFLQRLHPINFSQTVDIIDKASRESKKVQVKQFMTDMIIMAGQNKMLVMPSIDIDEDLENQFRNHTYSIVANGNIVYSKSNISPEHCIDALRTLYFAKSVVKKPQNRRLAVGSTFRSRSSGAWQ